VLSKKHATGTMTTTQAEVTGPTTRDKKNGGHKLYVYNFFSSPALFDNLHAKPIYSCCTDTESKLNTMGF
jgi:hypothetical protein